MSFLNKLFLLVLIIAACGFIYFSLSTPVTTNLDTYTYDLPFKSGECFKVVQGYGGMFSHKNKAAIDFQMPVGTPIHAARAGLVYSFKDNSDEGGPFSSNRGKANYLIIKHSDGSFGCYWHLKFQGVVTKKGKVKKGQLIAYSGGTGFVLVPHLHFAVKRRLTYAMNSFVQTKFKTNNGVQFLENGESYLKPSKCF